MPSPARGEGAITGAETALKAKIGHDVAALVLDGPAALGALERVLGIVIAERCRSLVVGLGGGRVLWPAAPVLRKFAHSLQGAGMVLRGGLLEQGARCEIVLRP